MLSHVYFVARPNEEAMTIIKVLSGLSLHEELIYYNLSKKIHAKKQKKTYLGLMF